jgi:hypothetical protein
VNLASLQFDKMIAEKHKQDLFEFYQNNWADLVNYAEQLESQLRTFEADDYNHQQLDPYLD